MRQIFKLEWVGRVEGERMQKKNYTSSWQVKIEHLDGPYFISIKEAKLERADF